MAEYVANAVQNVSLNAPILFNATIPCPTGCVFHEDETGFFVLRGKTNNCFARYQVTFNGNIAIPTGGAVTPIAVDCEKLAAVCTVLDHCYPEQEIQPRFESGYSGDIKADTQFLREVKGKNPSEYLPAIDELVTATMVYNPRLYASFMRKLTTY